MNRTQWSSVLVLSLALTGLACGGTTPGEDGGTGGGASGGGGGDTGDGGTTGGGGGATGGGGGATGGGGGTTGGGGGTTGGGGGSTGLGKVVYSCLTTGDAGVYVTDLDQGTTTKLATVPGADLTINATGSFVTMAEGTTGAASTRSRVIDTVSGQQTGSFTGKAIAWVDGQQLFAKLGTTTANYFRPVILGTDGGVTTPDFGFTVVADSRYAVSPQADRVVVRAGTSCGNANTCFIVTSLADTTQRVVIPPSIADDKPFWLPNGRLAWVTLGPTPGVPENNRVHFADPASATSDQVFDLRPTTSSVIKGARPWSDGKLLVAFQDGTTTSYVLADSMTGAGTPMTGWFSSVDALFDPTTHKLSLGHDGTRVMYMNDTFPATHLFLDTPTGSAPQQLAVPCDRVSAFAWSGGR